MFIEHLLYLELCRPQCREVPLLWARTSSEVASEKGEKKLEFTESPLRVGTLLAHKLSYFILRIDQDYSSHIPDEEMEALRDQMGCV